MDHFITVLDQRASLPHHQQPQFCHWLKDDASLNIPVHLALRHENKVAHAVHHIISSLWIAGLIRYFVHYSIHNNFIFHFILYICLVMADISSSLPTVDLPYTLHV